MALAALSFDSLLVFVFFILDSDLNLGEGELLVFPLITDED